MTPVFFDHNSTTALKTEVLEAMLPHMVEQHGNATSRHSYGRTARAAVEHAREQVANAVGAYANQVVFTASGTEANNFAVHGICSNLAPKQVLTSAVEHPCVSRPALALQAHGWQAKSIQVDKDCKIDMQHLQHLLQTPTGLVSVMLANNETGVIQDIAAINQLARQHNAYVHTDAVQALGKIPVDFFALGVHAMTVSCHKIGGPLGAGALVLDNRVDIQPLLYGGGQERGLRSGTENVPAIVGFGVACDLAIKNLSTFAQHTQHLRDALEVGLRKMNATLFGSGPGFSGESRRIPNTSFFAFPNIEGETLVTALDKRGFAVASGSACSSDSSEPSHVLLAMGVDEELARGAIRVSFGASNTMEQVQHFLVVLENELKRLRNLTAVAA
ncbi:MAG TPA: cysteine desulfurase family protein [Methylotenera sp.]|nr:cysteine desulfurase family protein [Methylotenera sp.]HPV45032.1 cysteine desulfurase family protein [Methylotenera sp.]